MARLPPASLMTYILVLLLVFVFLTTSSGDTSLSASDARNITASLERMDALLASRHVCNTTWMKEYATRHAALLPTRVLVHVPFMSGLADRIIGLVTSTAFAVVIGRAVHSGRRPPLQPLENIFSSPYINWTREYDADWLLEPLKDKANPKNYNASVLAQNEYNAIHTLNDYKLLDRFLRQDIDKIFGSARNIMFLMNRGKTIRLFENTFHSAMLKDNMGLTPEVAFGCITQFLLRPRPEIFATLMPQLERITSSPAALKIGIHVRAGDSVLLNANHNIDSSHYQSFFTCAQQIEDWARKGPGQQVIWYLATDSRKIREFAVAKYGDKILTSLTAHIEHSSKEQNTGCVANCSVSHAGFQHAAAEWWMMGACDYHVVTLNSGFGRSAGMRSLRRNHIYTVREDRRNPMKPCDNSTFTDLENLSYDWSGI